MMRKIWSSRAWDEYIFWQSEDKKTLQRINKLLKDIESNGCAKGIGKPEALMYESEGWYSRRIDDYNRLVYRMPDDATIEIAQCKGHYDS